jgi:hypothetical protein
MITCDHILLYMTLYIYIYDNYLVFQCLVFLLSGGIQIQEYVSVEETIHTNYTFIFNYMYREH